MRIVRAVLGFEMCNLQSLRLHRPGHDPQGISNIWHARKPIEPFTKSRVFDARNHSKPTAIGVGAFTHLFMVCKGR